MVPETAALASPGIWLEIQITRPTHAYCIRNSGGGAQQSVLTSCPEDCGVHRSWKLAVYIRQKYRNCASLTQHYIFQKADIWWKSQTVIPSLGLNIHSLIVPERFLKLLACHFVPPAFAFICFICMGNFLFTLQSCFIDISFVKTPASSSSHPQSPNRVICLPLCMRFPLSAFETYNHCSRLFLPGLMCSLLFLETRKFSRPVVSDSVWPDGLHPPGPSGHGLLQARIPEWGALPFSRQSPQARDGTQVSWVPTDSLLSQQASPSGLLQLRSPPDHLIHWQHVNCHHLADEITNPHLLPGLPSELWTLRTSAAWTASPRNHREPHSQHVWCALKTLVSPTAPRPSLAWSPFPPETAGRSLWEQLDTWAPSWTASGPAPFNWRRCRSAIGRTRLPWRLSRRESAGNAGDLGSSPGLGRSPGEGKGYPLQYSDREFQGLRSPWGHKELDMTERLSLSLYPVRHFRSATGVVFSLVS